jgi:uncharacterized protein YkwD
MKIVIRYLILGLSLLINSMTWAGPVHEHEESTDRMAVEVLNYVNQYRAAHGLPRLAMNEAANREARRHSQEMANHAVPFGHTGFGQRMKHLYHSIDDANGGAENVAYNYKTARIVVDGWIKSPGHHRNLVGRYNMTGIGIVRDKAGRLYYTQLFVRTEKHTHPSQKAHARGRSRTGFFIG